MVLPPSPRSTTQVDTLTHAKSPAADMKSTMLHNTDRIASVIDMNSLKPMKITCLTIGTQGDVQPYIALCQRLQQLGHTCTIATHKDFREWIEAERIKFAEVDGDPQELIKHCIEHGGFLSFSFWWKGLSRFSNWFNGLLTSSWEACKDSDLLIESPSAMVGVHIAQSLQIPYYRAFTMPWTKTGVYPHALAASGQNWASCLNRLSYIVFDWLVWKILGGRMNTWRTTQLGLKPTTFSELRLDKVPFLYNFSPSVVPKPNDWTSRVEITGYWFVKPSEKPKEAKILENKIAEARSRGKKIIYIGFGSMIIPDPEHATKAIIEALKNSNVFAIVSGGWTAQQSRSAENAVEHAGPMERAIKEHSDSMLYVNSVPHDWLFPKIDAALHHGGAGTTAASMRAGIPTLVKPFFGDQKFWAQRVEQLGVGSHIHALKAEELRLAIVSATTDQKQINSARILGKKIREENGVEKAIEFIFRNMDEAERLIRPPRNIALYREAVALIFHAVPTIKNVLVSGSRKIYNAMPTLRSLGVKTYAYSPV